MTVTEYLATYTLLTKLPAEIDYIVFKNRFVSTYGTRKIRADVPVDNISIIAQSVFDVNAALLTPLFTKNISPVLTWAENGDNTGTETGEDSGGSTTNTTESSNSAVTENTSTTTGTSTGTTADSVYAYNLATTATPTNNSKTDTTATNTTTNTAANNAAKTSETTENNNATHSTTNSGNYNKSGYNLADYERAFNAFVAPYDYLIKLIVNEICVTSFDLFDCGGVYE